MDPLDPTQRTDPPSLLERARRRMALLLLADAVLVVVGAVLIATGRTAVGVVVVLLGSGLGGLVSLSLTRGGQGPPR